jgi:hypothetical protein
MTEPSGPEARRLVGGVRPGGGEPDLRADRGRRMRSQVVRDVKELPHIIVIRGRIVLEIVRPTGRPRGLPYKGPDGHAIMSRIVDHPRRRGTS